MSTAKELGEHLKRLIKELAPQPTPYALKAIDQLVSLAQPGEGALTGPSEGLLMSMAIRYDNGLGVPGYYDTLPIQFGPSHKQRLEGTLRVMRQLWEEVSGNGFYSPEKEADYVAMMKAAGITSTPTGDSNAK